MKNLKSIVKTLLFSAFMTVVVSSNGNMLIPDIEMETAVGEDSISVCSEIPELEDSISGN